MKKVTKEEVNKAFEGTNFGEFADYFEILVEGVVNKAAGYHVGYTLETIMRKMGLIGKNQLPTSRGRQFMRDTYNIWSKL